MINFFSSFFFINSLIVLLLGLSILRRKDGLKIILLFILSIIPYVIFTFFNFFEDKISVSIGVSRAALLGVNPTSVINMLLLCTIIYVFLTLILWFVFAYFKRPLNFNFQKIKKVYKVEINRSIENTLLFSFTILSVIPLLRLRIDLIRGWKADLLGWDIQNFDTWNGLFLNGNVPMRDFWYPYGNLIALHAFPITGVLISFIANLLFLIYVRNISDLLKSETFSKIGIYISFFLILINFSYSNNFLAIPRYGLVPLALIYVTLMILRKNEFKLKNSILIVPPIIFSFYYSILFLLLVIFVISLYCLILIIKKESITSIFRQFAINKYVIFISFVSGLNILYGLFKGTFYQEVRMVFESRKYNQGLSFPMKMYEKFSEDQFSYSLMIIVFFMFLGLVIFNVLSISFITTNDISITLSLLTGLIYMYLSLQKYSVRGPTYDSWLVGICILTIFILASTSMDLKFESHKAIWPYGIGFISILLFLFVPFSNLSSNHSTFFNLIKNERQTMISKYSDVRNYAVKPEWVSTINFLNTKSSKRFFTLTDNGYLYLATGQLPYFHLAAHEMSNKIDDLDLVNNLKNDPPEYLVIDLHTLNFEQVNSSIRLPKTVQYLTHNFSFIKNFEDIYVFQKKTNNDTKIDDKFYSIFREVDLGQIPFRLNLSFSGECLKEYKNCQEYLRFNLKPNSSTCWLEFNFEGRSVRYTLNNRNGDQNLPSFAYFSLSNAWFYPSKFSNNILSNCSTSYSKIYANSPSLY